MARPSPILFIVVVLGVGSVVSAKDRPEVASTAKAVANVLEQATGEDQVEQMKQHRAKFEEACKMFEVDSDARTGCEHILEKQDESIEKHKASGGRASEIIGHLRAMH
eukprot:gnl/MRDRNA2_/MRDRNA2_101513_c0_seq1.p2 gnl/MRDRNA2_/MRDRNA2_101513_c0~~gnl/MRDRNA2_/MRDRNA2_101513_c0_seq1.p2  ORF type:complete len:108 (-),score=21.39 gnl/MRDRNA2_/MRDRNA2_101513_c0_seq1:16-339(-)